MSKKYGPVFTVYMGGKKVVVLAGYKTVKQALVQHAEAFGQREPILITQESNKEHGKDGRKFCSVWLVHEQTGACTACTCRTGRHPGSQGAR